jgi:hypothetical protein
VGITPFFDPSITKMSHNSAMFLRNSTTQLKFSGQCPGNNLEENQSNICNDIGGQIATNF